MPMTPKEMTGCPVTFNVLAGLTFAMSAIEESRKRWLEKDEGGNCTEVLEALDQAEAVVSAFYLDVTDGGIES